MKKLLFLLCIILPLFSSCSVHRKTISTKDVVVYHYVDSVVFHDSTIFIDIPREVVKEVVMPYDTLKMETSVARSVAYVDTLTHTLKGVLENKVYSLKSNVKWKEKIVYRDSISVKEITNEVKVPVPVTKYPKLLWYLLAYSIVSIVAAAFYVYLKLK